MHNFPVLQNYSIFFVLNPVRNCNQVGNWMYILIQWLQIHSAVGLHNIVSFTTQLYYKVSFITRCIVARRVCSQTRTQTASQRSCTRALPTHCTECAPVTTAWPLFKSYLKSLIQKKKQFRGQSNRKIVSLYPTTLGRNYKLNHWRQLLVSCNSTATFKRLINPESGEPSEMLNLILGLGKCMFGFFLIILFTVGQQLSFHYTLSCYTTRRIMLFHYLCLYF